MYKIDTHVHTAEVSYCAKVNARELIRMYKDIGYHGVIITDHYHENFFRKQELLNWDSKIDKLLEGYFIALEEAKRLNFKVFLGIELRFIWSANDYLVYGLDEEFLKNNQELYCLSLQEFKELIMSKNILIYQAHPFRSGMELLKTEVLDGVEVFNGNPRHDSQNSLAHQFARSAGLKMISGSDFHQKEDLGRGGIITEKEVNNMDELIKLLVAEEYELIGPE